MKPTFQDTILTLQRYWAERGCALLQPYDMEVGAGTSHTATFLRALGPEPWKAAYVQPSRRPKDGRNGNNPNRLQHYYQSQVVLKPAPADIDLTDVLAELQGMTSASARKKTPPLRPGSGQAPPPPAATLDEAFQDFRSGVSKQTGTHQAGEQLTLAKTYLEMGMADEAIAALTEASRVPTHRFEAASMLGRLYQQRTDPAQAVEWLELASEAPAPSAVEAHALLYELGLILELLGETARALAVLLELQADAGEYRDVAARVERLARVHAGG